MKRLLTFILFLIVAAATVTPCCLHADCTEELVTTLQSNSEKKEGTCSPFFSCASCSGFVWNEKWVQIAEPLQVQPEHFARINTDRPQPVYASFWQPPRV